jgi:hypothetical protein
VQFLYLDPDPNPPIQMVADLDPDPCNYNEIEEKVPM